MSTEAGWARLKVLVAEAHKPTYMTRGGVERLKTNKQRQIERAVVEEVVRFAFDHGGYEGEHLTPTGLFMALMDEVKAEQVMSRG